MAKRTNKAASKANETTAILYCRVSTDMQAEEGVSLDAQEDRLRAYCTLRGLTITAVVVDAGVSAGKPLETRDGGRRVLHAVRTGEARHVVALKLDRLFRNTVDCLTTVQAWDKADVSLHLVDMGGASLDTSTAMGRMFLTMAAGFAEMERALIGERTAGAMAHKRSRNEFCGGEAPFGFMVSDDGHLAPVAAEQEVITAAREAHENGLSLRAIAAELDRRGYRARTGKVFAATQIKRIIEAAA